MPRASRSSLRSLYAKKVSGARMSAYGQNLRRWRIAAATHDTENPGHDPAFGIGLCHFDIERLKLEVGEELWDGVTLHEDSGQSGLFRVMCSGIHDECDMQIKESREREEDRPLRVVSPELVPA